MTTRTYLISVWLNDISTTRVDFGFMLRVSSRQIEHKCKCVYINSMCGLIKCYLEKSFTKKH